MSAQFMRYLLTGLTVGAIYALVALGFHHFRQPGHQLRAGEFVMIGGWRQCR
jgi:branched-subunit amino acid ABC-type transport system permease component